MNRIATLAVALLVVFLPGAQLSAQVHAVSVPCCGFVDSATGNNNTFIPIGATVQWTRVGIIAHTVTSGTGPTDPAVGALFNASLSGAVTTFSTPFGHLGTFPYFCSFHFAPPMNMVGTVYVLPAASTTVVGTGCASSAGTLVLGTNGLPRLGNGTFGFTLSGGPAGAAAALYLSLGTNSGFFVAPGCFAYIDIASTQLLIAQGITPTPTTLSGAGTATFTFPLGFDPSLGGLSGAAQAIVYDGAAPNGAGFAVSNAIAVVLGA